MLRSRQPIATALACDVASSLRHHAGRLPSAALASRETLSIVSQAYRPRTCAIAGKSRIARSYANVSIQKPLTPVKDLADLQEGTSVILAGWLGSIRKVSKKLAFAILHFPRGQGQIQLIASSTGDSDVADTWEKAGLNGVILVEGVVRRKPAEALREGQSSSPLAQLEIRTSDCVVLNTVAAGSLPFNPLETGTYTTSIRDEVRMRHRALDLRGTQLGNNIRLRSKVSQAVRNRLHEQDFTEIETPVLLRSTPEGAREYLVPTRARGDRTSESSASQPQFYALQQSPQQPKQLLVISGVTDRYFQIARCFRDEDGRKDRQPEFTQIDLETSFPRGSNARHAKDDWSIGGHDIRIIIEDLIRTVWQAAGREDDLNGPFRVMTYTDAMTSYGSDKPDLRYDLAISSLGKALQRSDNETESLHDPVSGNDVEVLSFTPPPGTLSSSVLDGIFAAHADLLQGVEKFRTEAGNVNVLAKLLMRKSSVVQQHIANGDEEMTAMDVSVEKLVAQLQAAQSAGRVHPDVPQGDKTWTFVASRSIVPQGGSTKLGELRRLFAQHLSDAGALPLQTLPPQFVWIVEFPLFTRADADKAELSGNRWSSSHHPFTSPKDEDADRVMELLSEKDKTLSADDEDFLARVVGQHYDLVLNGVEIGGGSVRIHDAELQRRILANMLQLSDAEMQRFSHLLDALKMGAPPHAGIALGFDRLMAILCDTPTIRDVIAFPKSANGRDLLFGSPDVLDVPEVTASNDLDAKAKHSKAINAVLKQYNLQTL